MHRCLNRAVWLGISVVLGAAGCSGESVPPFVATSPPGDERPNRSDALPAAALAGPVEAQTVEHGHPFRAAQETADLEHAPGMAVPTIGDQAELAGALP